MKLSVYVQSRVVATLESPDDFEHVLTYHPGVASEDFISLLMPVRTKSYVYPELHPVFRMNLPEGYLLSVLQQRFGPLIGASPMRLLSVVGRNAIGRVKVVPEGADPIVAAPSFELRDILRGDNSEAAFVELVHRYAESGVSGVVPKFLAPASKAQGLPPGLAKSTLATDRFIIKGTTHKLPGVALNEHFCMEVARRAFGHAAKTEVSEDGQALVVHRFDYTDDGTSRLGMEDLCSLLALRPEEKYESTWEKVANRIKDVVPPASQGQTLSRLGELLLMTYALRNADCHTKNIALLYTGSSDIRLAPTYDMLTITVYEDYCNNMPGMSVHGRSNWRPGKALEIFLQTHCGMKLPEVAERVSKLCESVVDVSRDVVQASRTFKSFESVGPRMLHAWNEGINSLRLQKTWSLPSLEPVLQAQGLADVAKPKAPPKKKLGKSALPLMS